MIITYDQAKDAANQAKHGVSLAAAEALEWETLLAKRDMRRDYGEDRFIGFAIIKSRLYCVVFTDRGEQRRIISLRKANLREVKAYAENN
jgi:uncharacterized DUF497 family protein